MYGVSVDLDEMDAKFGGLCYRFLHPLYSGMRVEERVRVKRARVKRRSWAVAGIVSWHFGLERA